MNIVARYVDIKSFTTNDKGLIDSVDIIWFVINFRFSMDDYSQVE